ncbi:hypothetical protein KS4_12210 [Poriferisphaera corsica]|uniref:Uncharacterized protein n=1 Tax=Poriferisphaera corsica TaxID=2528020 RepID=A0A517YSH7_9BACT|nr:hypothetical protein KS4_12210 [Poriferisphaera corsica]
MLPLSYEREYVLFIGRVGGELLWESVSVGLKVLVVSLGHVIGRIQATVPSVAQVFRLPDHLLSDVVSSCVFLHPAVMKGEAISEGFARIQR